MIHIDIPKEPDSSAWRGWRRDCETKTRKLIEDVQNGKKPKIDDIYKKKNIRDEFFFCKTGPFKGKCSYCESYIDDSRNCDIDHYRPKGRVTDEDDHPVMIKDEGGRDIYHPGYYWLAYDWRNLLPVCKYCNEPSNIHGKKVGKCDRFPVVGPYGVRQGEESKEQPLLLHPVFDEPEEHLFVKIETGIMIRKTPRGEKTIEILGLNSRDNLLNDRRYMINHVKSLWDRVFSEYADEITKKKAIDELIEIKMGYQAYTLAARTCLKERVGKIPPKAKQLLISD